MVRKCGKRGFRRSDAAARAIDLVVSWLLPSLSAGKLVSAEKLVGQRKNLTASGKTGPSPAENWFALFFLALAEIDGKG